MKIQILTYSITRNAGGVFDAVRDMFTNKAFANIQLNIISFFDNYIIEDKKLWGNIQIQLFKAGIGLHSSKAKQALFNSNANILHMEALWRIPQLWMSDWKAKKQTPIVCSPHGMLDPWIIKKQGFFKRAISNVLFDKSLKSVTCFHALCMKEMEDIRAYGLKQPIAVIPNGINIPSKETKQRIQALIPPHEKELHHLLYLGRLHKKKGIDILLSAIANIQKKAPSLLDSWQIDIVGWDDECFKSKLEKICRDNNLHNIVFHGGKFGDEKLIMQAQASAYILPSHGEGLPMTVLEAWAWNLPVIITPECHLPEGYSSGAAIYIKDNVESCQEGLLRLFSMSDMERKEMGNNGRKLVAEQFTWDISAKKMTQVYDWLLGNAPKPNFVFE